MEKVSLENGKYEIKVDDKTGAMTFLRNGEAWPGGQEAFQHAKIIYCMVARILELEKANAGLVAKVKAAKEAGMAMLKQEMERTQMVMDLREQNAGLVEALKKISAMTPEQAAKEQAQSVATYALTAAGVKC